MSTEPVNTIPLPEVLKSIALSYGLTYEQVCRDFRAVHYSSVRHMMLLEREGQRAIVAEKLIPQDSD